MHDTNVGHNDNTTDVLDKLANILSQNMTQLPQITIEGIFICSDCGNLKYLRLPQSSRLEVEVDFHGDGLIF